MGGAGLSSAKPHAIFAAARYLKAAGTDKDLRSSIDNPTVRVKPSRYAIRVPVRRAPRSHRGE